MNIDKDGGDSAFITYKKGEAEAKVSLSLVILETFTLLPIESRVDIGYYLWAVFAMIKYDFKRPVQSILVQLLWSRVLPNQRLFFTPG